MSFADYTLTIPELILFFSAAVLVGMAKTGVHGAGMIAVPMLAMIFGGQKSSGILLPILCFADILGVIYYHQHASRQQLIKLFPAAALGIIAGTIAGNYINDHAFKFVMAVIIVVIVVLMIWMERTKKAKVPSGYWFSRFTGFAGGFTSMIGNLAGSVMALYFLSVRMPKAVYIGTTAWFFLVINFFKVPFHVFVWETITAESVLLDLVTIPFILLGAVAGVLIVRRIGETYYRWFIITMTLIAALMMVVKAW